MRTRRPVKAVSPGALQAAGARQLLRVAWPLTRFSVRSDRALSYDRGRVVTTISWVDGPPEAAVRHQVGGTLGCHDDSVNTNRSYRLRAAVSAALRGPADSVDALAGLLESSDLPVGGAGVADTARIELTARWAAHVEGCSLGEGHRARRAARCADMAVGALHRWGDATVEVYLALVAERGGAAFDYQLLEAAAEATAGGGS